jgi:plastocyanin
MPAVRRTSLAFALVCVAASALTLAAPPPTRAARHAVQITDGAFSPATLTISVGDTVTWRNADDRPHTVTSTDGAFDSGNLDEGVGFSFTFNEPGTYTYLCQYHTEMQATIVVEAANDAQPASGATDATDGTATGGEGVSAATHAGGTHGGDQPDTALELPASLAWLAPLLIGLGLLALAFGVIPPAREVVRVERPGVGWRR